MADNKNIKELKCLAERLVRLLAEPEPGFITWHMLVGLTARQIGEFVGMVAPEKEAT